MSDLLSIGASGVRAYQSALTTVSDNIANVGNAGYARRSTTLSEVGSAGAGLTARGVDAGSGVVAGGIARAADMFKADAVRVAGADLAKTEAGAVWLDRIQDALTGNQLGDRLTSFFTSATALAADPSAAAPRAVMLEAGAGVASAFAASGAALTNVNTELDATAEQAVTSLESLGTALAKVNSGLGRAGVGTGAAASLADQRDQLLEQMSAITDVNVTTDAIGRATVRIGGSGGAVFVAGDEAGRIAYARNDDGQVGFTMTRGGIEAVVSPNGGALAGIVDGAQRIADARDALDSIAKDFVDGVNAVQAGGRDLAGDPGVALFSTTGGAAGMTLALDDPAGIAAASPGGGTRSNANLANLQALRTSGGFEGRTTTLIATNAATLQQRQTIADAQGAIRDGAVSARDAVSGVDLDQEAVELMRFQQAYSASSRVIQAARDTFQSILDIR